MNIADEMLGTIGMEQKVVGAEDLGILSDRFLYRMGKVCIDALAQNL
jgi:hypothetical protein